jgi:hypothetical protein
LAHPFFYGNSGAKFPKKDLVGAIDRKSPGRFG